MIKVFGITGGIGSGKTTLSKYLKKTGFSVHESDKVVFEIYKNPNKTFLSFLKKNISTEVVKKNKINKKKIINIIFNNKQKKKKLENHIHKEVKASRENFIKKKQKKQKRYCFCRHTTFARKQS